MLNLWKKACLVFAVIASTMVLGTGASWADTVVNREPDERVIATAEANNPDYWGEDCVKYEYGGLFWTLDAPVRLLVIKSGTTNDIWNTPAAGKYGPASRKNISHVIVCGQTPSESPSPSTSPSPSNSPSPSTSPTPSPSVTPSVTPSPTVTPTPSVSTPAPAPPKKAVATLPKTGPDDALGIALVGLTLLGLGGALLLLLKAFKNDFPKD